MDTLLRVGSFMNEVTDLNRLLTQIMNESEQVMESLASACMLYDETSDELYFEVATGSAAAGVKTIRLKRGTGIAWECLEKRQTLIVNNPYEDGRFYKAADEKSKFTTRNMVATPMMFRGEIIGVLEVLNRKEGDYDDQDGKILQIVADQAAMAIANARLVERSIQRERLAAIGLAVSGIAHHLKNIILSIKGPLGLIRMGLKAKKIDLISETLPIMERGSARMEQSVKEMLDYSKDREPELEQGNIGDLLREVTGACRTRAEQHGVELREQIPTDLPDSYLDKYRFHDALLNMLGNAIEAHGPEVPPDAFVEVRARQSQNGVLFVVEIEDNGPGIPSDVLRRIFQPFFSTKGAQGTGLGLAVAQKVAEENGGTLYAESEPGKGTTFTLTLPIFLQPPARQSRPIH